MLNDKICVYCFKDKKWINADDCSFKSGKFKHCYLYNLICHKLYPNLFNSYKPKLSPEAESIKEIKELIELIKAGKGIFMLSTNEMIEFLENTYNLNVSRELIFQYSKLGFLTPEKKRAGQRGKGLGVKTYWPNSAPVKVYIIKELLKQSCTLQDIKKYKDTIYEFKEDFKLSELSIIEQSKFRTTLTYFACAEANLKGSHNLYSLFEINRDNDNKIKEIHVILKDLNMPGIWDSKEQVEKRLAADIVLLKYENKMIYSQEDLDVLKNNLKTINEIVFSKDGIKVL